MVISGITIQLNKTYVKLNFSLKCTITALKIGINSYKLLD